MLATLLIAPQALPFSNIEVITLFVWILMVIAGLAMAGLVWFTVRTLKLINENQKEMFHRLKSLEDGFIELKTEHNMMKKGRHAP